MIIVGSLGPFFVFLHRMCNLAKKIVTYLSDNVLRQVCLSYLLFIEV